MMSIQFYLVLLPLLLYTCSSPCALTPHLILANLSDEGNKPDNALTMRFSLTQIPRIRNEAFCLGSNP